MESCPQKVQSMPLQFPDQVLSDIKGHLLLPRLGGPARRAGEEGGEGP